MSDVASEPPPPEPGATPAVALTILVVVDAFLATILVPVQSSLLAVLIELPRHEAHDGTVIGIALLLMLLLGPSLLTFAAALACASWAIHGLAKTPRPIAIDAGLGSVAGGTVALGFLVQDVLGIRPDSLVDGLTDPQCLVIVASSVVFGALLGLASGALARWITRALPAGRRAASRIVGALNLVLIYAIGLPGIAMLFTFAHFTGRTGRWEFVATPFVFAMGLVVMAGAGGPLLLALGLIVAGHRLLVRGAGTFVLDAVVGIGLGAAALVFGVSVFDRGMDNFEDLGSFAVAATAALVYCGVLGATYGLSFGEAPAISPSDS